MLLRTLTICLLATSFASQASTHGFQSNGRFVSLADKPQWITVRSTADADSSRLISRIEALTGPVHIAEHSESRNTWLIELQAAPKLPAVVLNAIGQLPQVVWANHAYTTTTDDVVGLTDEIIVGCVPSARAQVAALAHQYNAHIVAELPFQDGVLVTSTTGSARDIWQLVADLKRIDGVSAQPNFIRPIDRRFLPNDPYIQQQWYLAPIDAPAAWDSTFGNPDVIIAIMDDGFDMTHEDLTGPGKLAPGAYDFSADDPDPSASYYQQHGTAVAGIAIAEGNNGLGIAGVCPTCRYMPIKQGPTSYDIAAAFQHIGDYGAHVVNNSWGFYNPSTVVTNAILSLAQNGRGGLGTLVLFASGNDGVNIDTYNDISASNGAIAISAVSYNEGLASYSNYGPSVDLAAPADGQVTTDLSNGGYANGKYTGTFGGTSGAAPVAAGVAGLIFSVDPTMTAQAAFNLLAGNTDKIGSNYGQDGKSNAFGYGRVNAAKAINAAGAPVDQAPPPTPEPTPEPAQTEPSSSCVDACGGQAPSGCYCDTECAQYGDCCEDVCDVCGGCEDTAPSPGTPQEGTDSSSTDAYGCGAFFDCSTDCTTQVCIDECASPLTTDGIQQVNAVYGCLETSGCLSAGSDQQFQNCVATYCGTEINDCFSGQTSGPDDAPPTEPNPSVDSNPEDATTDEITTEDPADSETDFTQEDDSEDDEPPASPAEQATADNTDQPYEETVGTEMNGGESEPIAIETENYIDESGGTDIVSRGQASGCTAGHSGSESGIPFILLLGLSALGLRQRKHAAAMNRRRPIALRRMR